MADWKCARCGGTDVARLEKAPFRGALGGEIREKVCEDCWERWHEARVMLLNEYHLNMADPDHYHAVVQQMKYFLGLEEPPKGD